MSAEKYLKENGIHPHSLVRDNNDIRKVISGLMESYAREYHAKEMERKLETVHESHIEEAAFNSMNYRANPLDKRYGFIKGAQWLLTHLKEQKQDKG